MSEPAPASTAITLIFVIPFLWSGLLYAASYISAKNHHPQDKESKQFLLLMLAPSLLGGMAYFFAGQFSENLQLSQFIPAFQGDHSIVNSDTAPLSEEASKPFQVPLIMILSIIYSSGVVIHLLRLGFNWASLAGILKTAQPARLSENSTILLTDKLVSPFAHISGKIILPQRLLTHLTPEQIELIIAHEKFHLARKDSTYFLALAIVDILFWFNPFLCKQTQQCRLAAELACDRAVTSRYPYRKNDYAAAMITTLELINSHTPIKLAPSFNNSTQGEFRMRLQAIFNRRKTTASKKLFYFGLLSLLPLSFTQAALAGNQQTDGMPQFSTVVLSGKITSRFGERHDPFNQKKSFHRGMDFKAEAGTPVLAPAPGKVLSTERHAGYGLLLSIDHGSGYITRYANLSAFEVEKGQKVKAGQLIAKSGNTGRSTGPHLHLEVIKDGEFIDPATILTLPKQD